MITPPKRPPWIRRQYNVKRLEDLQSFTKIYAPFDGVITARNTDIGQLIDSGSAGPAKELFHVAAIRTLRVYHQRAAAIFRCGEARHLRRLHASRSFPGRKFQGKLVRTANAIDLASRTLLVEVDVDNTTDELLPGAFTEVHLKMPTDSSDVTFSR